MKCSNTPCMCEAGAEVPEECWPTRQASALCAGCGHSAEWHGDRAIVACDGGYGIDENGFVDMPGTVWQRSWKVWGCGPVCGCPGWS